MSSAIDFLPHHRTQYFPWDFYFSPVYRLNFCPIKCFDLSKNYLECTRPTTAQENTDRRCDSNAKRSLRSFSRTVINRRRARHGPCLVYELIFGNRQKASGSGVDFLADNDYARRTNVRRRIVSSAPNTYSIPDLSS